MQRLAQSKSYIIEHEHETVILLTSDNRKVVIGDFFGDPEVAVIDKDEKWCAMGGCGLIVYWLEEPFVPYRTNVSSPHWLEFNRHDPDIWWIRSIEQTGPTEIEVQRQGGKMQKVSFERTPPKPKKAAGWLMRKLRGV